MEILFIRPDPPEETIGLQHVMVVEPLELEILATLVAKNNSVEIVDLILEKKPLSYFLHKTKPDVVCVTGYITHVNKMIDVCSEAKSFNENIKTIVGGVYIEQLPETIDHPDVDYRVVRNATTVFPALINHLKGKGKLPAGALKAKEKNDEKALPEYDFFVPIPDRELTAKYRSKYFYVFHNKVALIKTSFGCPYPCSFCFCRKITGDNYFERDIEEVIQELLAIKEKEVYIIDDNFLVSPERVRKFLSLIDKHNIKKKYLIYGRADFIAAHPDIMKDFKKRGLRTIIVGFESFNDEELDNLKKNTLATTNEQAMHILNKNKVDCYASVIAMPEWSVEDFDRETKKLIELKIRFLNVQPLTPLEKTDMEFDESKLIIPRDDYPKWDLSHVVVKPEKMTVKEYYSQILRMYERVLFRPSNMISHMKYPLHMHYKLLKGAFKVRRQLKSKAKTV